MQAIGDALVDARRELEDEMKSLQDGLGSDFFNMIWACKIYPENIDELNPSKPDTKWGETVFQGVPNRNSSADAHEYPIRFIV